MRIGHLSTAYHTNFVIMDNDDLASDLNANVEWILFGTGPAMVQAFKEKRLDAGYMGLPPAIIGIDKGVPIECVAGGHVEGTIMIGKIEYKSIENTNGDLNEVLQQFSGKAVGVPSRGSIHDVILNHILEKHGLINEVEIKNYAQAEFIALDMKKGLLEGGVGTPALAVFASTLLESHLIIPPNYLWENNPSYGIFFHKDVIKNKPEVVTTFLNHHKKASTSLRDNPEESAAIIAKTFEILNKEYARAVLEISPKYCIALSEGYVDSTMKFVKTLYELKYITRPLTTAEIFQFDFVNKLHPEKHHYIV